MSLILEDYLKLIPAENRQKPNFIAMVSDGVSALVDIQRVFESMIPKFDIDLATGEQLDIIGLWAGITRNVEVPIPGVYFSWDTTDAQGWEYGIWRADKEPASITVLPDDVFRTFIKAKIAANRWNGTLQDMYAVWDSVFTDITLFVQDNQNMSYNIGFAGRPIDSLTLALIQQGYLPLKPEGVRVEIIYAPVDANRIFAWDTDNTIFGGWDEASWARILT